MPLAPHGRPNRGYVFVVLLLVLSPFLRGAEADSPWAVRVWKMGEDLAGNNLAGVTQSADGFIWVVAGGELARFDGASFRHFPVAEISGDPGLKIREFTPLRGGGLAFALVGGTIARTAGGKVEVLYHGLNEFKTRVESLFEDADGSLLITCGDETVFRLRDGQLMRFTEGDGLPAGLHCRFVTDRTGRLWFAKGLSVGLLRNDRFATLQQLPAASLRTAIAPAERGGVWIGAGSQLFQYDEGQPLVFVGELGLKNVPVRPTVLREDRTGAIWFGTYASGLFRFAGARCEDVPISHRQVVSLTEDREGSLWVGTSGGGLNQVQPRALTIEGDEAGRPSETPQAICEDSAHHLWAVTQNGLLVARGGAGWTTPDGLALANATCLAADPAGGIWIGSTTGQLHRWSDGRLTTWGREAGLAGLPIRLLVATRSGDIWTGSSRPAALQRLRARKFETIALTPQTDQIRAITEDAAGEVWIAGIAKTLWRITRDDRIVDESHLVQSPPRQIRTMRATEDGCLWIGFDQDGVGLIKEGRLGRITTQNGLWSDRIELLIPDDRGGLWLAANQSIFKVNESELVAVAEGRAPRVTSVRYGQDEGVRAVFGASVGALLRSDGRVWIPMATSLAIIDPGKSRPAAAPPPVVITEVKLDERLVAAHRGFVASPVGVVPEATALRLPPGHRRLDFAFTALSFRTPSNVRFRYRLDGFDSQWSEAGPHRSVSYPQLPAGDYRFRVLACNSEGLWNEAGATLAFAVEPFFWATWWFRALALTTFTSAIFGLARYVSHRRLQLKLRASREETAVERERVRIARDIHDDLGSRLTKIVLLTGLVARDRVAPEKAGERVWEISETARQLLGSLDETVWAVNPRNDTLASLIAYIGEFTVDFLRTGEILCHVDMPDPPPSRAISADVRHNLFLVVKEALNNVVRHAQANAAWLRIVVTEDALTLTIEDNGQGFVPSPEDPHANGLRNMRQRMTQIGGQFQADSTPGAGTRISLVFPWSARR